MRDPYIQKDGTLKNLLGIKKYEELNQAEKDIGYVKLLNVEDIEISEINIDLLKRIHKHIFGDIFEWAGDFRTVPVYKQEVVIPGISLEYTAPKEIQKRLQAVFKVLNTNDWKNKNRDEVVKDLTMYLSKIWRIHPFRDGNTRTTLAFATTFAKSIGLEIDISSMLDDLSRIVDSKTGRIIRPSLRDMFVLASLDEKDYPETEHLQKVLGKAIIGDFKEKKTNSNDIIDR